MYEPSQPRFLPKRPLIGVPVGATGTGNVAAGMARIAQQADVAELRLDLLPEPYDLAELLQGRPCPVMVTLRSVEQGGRSQHTPSETLAVLMEAARLGAELVDVEWEVATETVISNLQAAGARVIVSHHDFMGMPARLEEDAARMADLGADVVKIVGLARDVRDGVRPLRLLRTTTQPTIAFTMGDPGIPSRVLALRERSCFLTFASLSEEAATAPGQVSLETMRQVYRSHKIQPGTSVLGVLAPTPPTDLLAQLNAWCQATGLDAVAVPFPTTRDPADVIRAYGWLPVSCWLVEEDAFQEPAVLAVDTLARSAREAGRVNVIEARDYEQMGAWLGSREEQRAFLFQRLSRVAAGNT